MLVFDATPLIYLAKVGKLHLLRNISEKKVIPRSVFEEVVVKGKEAGKVDALIVERLIEQGVFQVTEVEETDVYRKLMKKNKIAFCHCERKNDSSFRKRFLLRSFFDKSFKKGFINDFCSLCCFYVLGFVNVCYQAVKFS